MKAERSSVSAVLSRAVLASLLASLLASCTSSTDPQLEVGSPGFAASGTAALSAVDTEPSASVPETAETALAEEPALPDNVASMPSTSPQAPPAAAQADTPAEAAAQPDQTAAASPAPEAANLDGPGKPNLFADPTPAQIASAAPPNLIDKKKRGFFSSLFSKPDAAATAIAEQPEPVIPAVVTTPAETPKSKPIIQLASADAGGVEKASSTSLAFGNDGNALPGVRQTMLFEIKRKSGIDDDSDVDVHEEDDLGPIQVASAAGLARLAPNGLLKQNDTVDTACLKPSLVQVLRTAEQHFGQKAMITSGFRDPERNRRARGAKRSLHMYCAAADVQLPGVSKWELAAYFRSMPGRGGVGTYCHTESVHVDVGPERDWNWRCRRRR